MAGLSRIGAVAWLSAGAARRADAIDADRPIEILDGFFAQVAVAEPQLRGDLMMGRFGKTDAAGLGQALQPGGQIDAIAVEIAALHHDIAQIDADPQQELLARRQRCIRRRHPLLDIHGALHGIDHAGEFHQHAIAHQLEDPAAMLADQWLEHLATPELEGRQGSRLVRAHETAVAHQIGG